MKRGDLSKLKVLIVEDNFHMTNLVKTVLRGFGVKYFIDARSGEEARKMFRIEPVDLVIIDYMLEDEEGTDVVKFMRTHGESQNPYIPIIMLSAFSERARVESARDVGVTEFCRKPIAPRDLYQKLAACVETPRSFVRTALYFGPDRRRRSVDEFKGEDRREDAAQQAVENS